MSECLFCKIIAGDVPSNRVYEDDAVVAFLDIHPINPGHTLIVPRRHSENILDARPEDLRAAIGVVQKIAPAALAATGAPAFNVGVNNGSASGQVIGHLHFHLMPRSVGDGHQMWQGTHATPEDLKKIAEAIRSSL